VDGPADPVRTATDDGAWLSAMLAVEAAVAGAAAHLGLVDPAAAEAVVRACVPEAFDVAVLADGRLRHATPVVALVERLRALVPDGAQPAVHFGLTSQDVTDTAAMLVTRSALVPILDRAGAVADLLAGLATRYRDAPQAGRTLLQQAAPTTFGAACAARLVAVDEAALALADLRDTRLAVQLGGPVATLERAGSAGPALVAEVARRLGLAVPVVPWHTGRGRIGALAAALGVLSGELAAVAQDVVLLSSSEIGEVSVARAGGSSAMAHKRNPASAVLAVACAHRTPGLVATLLAGMPQELQRSAGRWQAEVPTLVELLRLTGATAGHVRDTLDGLVVDQARMRAAASALAAASGGDPSDPQGGGAASLVDRALAFHRAQARTRSETTVHTTTAQDRGDPR